MSEIVMWKAVLPASPGVISIEVTKGAELLSAREHNGGISIWFRGDASAEKERREIVVAMTGGTVPEAPAGRFLGTAIFEGGAFVLHVFEQRR